MIDLSIPGQMTENELRGIEAIAAGAPQNAQIVEIGSLFGLSSVTWASSAPLGSTVFCIDPWVREQWIIDLVETKIPNCPIFSREAFNNFTKSYKNITPLQGYSPQDFTNWRQPVDVLFDDAMHHNPFLRTNLRFWLQFMKPGAVMCGHDYCQMWPDVIAEVNLIAEELKIAVFTTETLWWMRMPNDFRPKSYNRRGHKSWQAILQP
ncbi:MAG: class I SAM-dependent methyltransferase [Methylovirgula sp.]|uniref:class I SAM-dependent methyltransferase n=1 Tax=Methylovirgula sp. TaxID=1978224 RepID=UPI003076384E